MSYGLYLHIPYCRRRCNYCDFYTAGGQSGVPQEYICALLRDFAVFAPKDKHGKLVPPATVYFGGGTPSLLAPKQMDELMAQFSPAQGAEVTIEANPEELTIDLLKGYKDAGVNRLSLGVQTASQKTLEVLGRRHTPQDAVNAFKLARKAGFSNISGDIMLALPGYTNAEFDNTLKIMQSGEVTHISAYLLKVEDGTPFGVMPPENMPNSDEAAGFYLYAVHQLCKAGYKQYEISNFAKKGYEGRHNLIYWNCGDYLGLGAAAHSCMGGERFSFAADTGVYMQKTPKKIEQGICDETDFIMLQLRLASGLDESELAARFGKKLDKRQLQALETFTKHGLAEHKDSRWSLTPSGMLLQNDILARLL